MKCSVCQSTDHAVLDTVVKGDAIRRRRCCTRCKHRWTTFELAEGSILDREAILANVRSLEALVSQRG